MNDLDNPLFDDDDELVQDLHPSDYRALVVYSRDWTVGTVLEQIREGNIKLDPEFQRRNAWNDEKRSGLIESLLVGIPIPQLVLAEDPEKRKSYIVIDGRQRLLTIAGFADPTIDFWRKPLLNKLKLRPDLDGQSYQSLSTDYRDAYRELTNADIRCAVIASSGSTNDFLYYVFYRLNSGSVSLSTQELRQALSRGGFSRYLNSVTSSPQPIHEIMGIEGPDNRYRDAEVLLRYFAFSFFMPRYRGNLKDFLDTAMDDFNANWAAYEPQVQDEYRELSLTLDRLKRVFGERGVGRRQLPNGSYDQRFNRALFEVETYFFRALSDADIDGSESNLATTINRLVLKDTAFRASISSTTKSLEQYRIRFSKMRQAIEKALPVNLDQPAFV